MLVLFPGCWQKISIRFFLRWIIAPGLLKIFKAIKQVVINVMALESTYSISGDASIKEDKIEDIPLKLSLIQINVKEVRDVMFYGSKIPPS